MEVRTEPLPGCEGKDIFMITLCNDTGLVVNIINYGAIIRDILLSGPDKLLGNLVLSYDNMEDYYADPHYIGCVIGRYANRIGGGSLRIRDQAYQLSRNEGRNHLHGGYRGFNKKVWNIRRTFQATTEAGVTLSTLSPHLEEGYPGNLEAEVSYILTHGNELFINYKATTDRPTIVNLTSHTYFNLSAGESDISNHLLSVLAGSYTPSDDQFIPLGGVEPVDNTVFDLRAPAKVSAFMHHLTTVNYCLDNNREFKPAAILTDPESRTSLEVRTTNPGLQLYCGNYLSGKYKPFAGICLEPHYYPDSPNHVKFPSALLLPGRVYNEMTSYRFISA